MATFAVPRMNSEIPSHSGFFRKPVRLTITMPHSIYAELQRVSSEQGRSLSNLASYLIEGALVRFTVKE